MSNLATNFFTWALVTGASTGIGRALCLLLADEGVNLIVVARNEGLLKSLAQEIGDKVKIEILVADLSDKDQRKQVVEKIIQRVPDLIINNAGWGYYGDALTRETLESMNMLEVNAAALMELSLEGARGLYSAGKKGVIMNISSAAAFQIFPSFSVYAATKAFVNRFSESFDEEMKPYGIRVLASCPGMVDTEFQARAASKKVNKDPSYMTTLFAAKEIRKQISTGKKVHTFNWKYRLATFLTRYLIPNWLIVKALKSNSKFKNSKKPFLSTKFV